MPWDSVALTLLVLWTIAGTTLAAESNTQPVEGYEITFPAMGSTISISAYAASEADATKAFEAVQKEVGRLVDILSDYEADSELNRFVMQANQPTVLLPDLWNVLMASERWYVRTGGTFDASVGSLTQMWRNARRKKKIPTPLEIDQALKVSGWQNVHLDPEEHTGLVAIRDLKIDLGGIAAGYIVDRAFEVLQTHGLRSCLINAGGDIRCGEAPPGRIGWRIEVAPIAAKIDSNKPMNPSEKLADPQPLRRIYLSNASIVTSGDLWQFIDYGGVRRSHILDPKTGIGVPGPSVVAVIAKDCIDADAAATAISVMGLQKGMLFASQQLDLAAMMVARPTDTAILQYRITANFPEGIFEAP